jgi:hypothetical protein
MIHVHEPVVGAGLQRCPVCDAVQTNVARPPTIAVLPTRSIGPDENIL